MFDKPLDCRRLGQSPLIFMQRVTKDGDKLEPNGIYATLPAPEERNVYSDACLLTLPGVSHRATISRRYSAKKTASFLK
jgi:hypothetical protein